MDTLQARLTLFGFLPTPVTLFVEKRDRAERVTHIDAIELKKGTTLRFPQNVACYNCHEHPFLEAGDAPPVDFNRPREPEQPEQPVGERRPLKIWSPAGSDW